MKLSTRIERLWDNGMTPSKEDVLAAILEWEAPRAADEVVEKLRLAWNRHCVPAGCKAWLPGKITPTRRGEINGRLAEHKDWTDDDWSKFFGRVAASPFLTGKRCEFSATAIWVFLPTNFEKITEGCYDPPASLSMKGPVEVYQDFTGAGDISNEF